KPGRKRIMLEQQAEHGFAFAQFLFASAAFNGQGDVSADGIEKLKVAVIVGVFVLIVLHNQHAYGGGGRLQGHPEPCGGRRPDKFHLTKPHQAVEFGLRDQVCFSGAEDIRGTTAAHFLRRRGSVVFIGKKRKLEDIALRIVQRDEAVFGGQNVLECLMNSGEKLVQVGGLVQCVNDV